jgi:hypothetical protein
MDLESALRALYDEEVEAVLIGGAAMALLGSSLNTKDIDFCYQHSKQNAERLARAMAPHHPRLRNAPAGLPFRFDAETIHRGLDFRLTTDLGDIDFLAEVAGLGFYDAVQRVSINMNINGIDCQVLSVAGLIKAKKAAGRPRDLYALPELEALEELRKKSGFD